MRLVYMGSPECAVLPLQLLFEKAKSHGHEVIAVVSQPPRRKGRSKRLIDPPVARWAKEHGILTLQPEKVGSDESLSELRDLNVDLFITVSYGQILTDNFLKIPKRGTINIHPSLIPQYRGAVPVPAALLNGDKETGVTVLFTVKKLDAGHIIEQKKVVIGKDEKSDELLHRLFAEGGELLFKAFEKLKDPDYIGEKQDESKVTHCKKITKDEGFVDWSMPASILYNRFRAFYPWPGSYTFLGAKRIVIESMSLVEGGPSLEVGEVKFDKPSKVIMVGTSKGVICIDKLKPAGSKIIDAVSFWNGLKNKEAVKFSLKEIKNV